MKAGVKFNELPLICQDCERLRCISLYMNGTAYYSCGNPICKHRNELHSIYMDNTNDNNRNNTFNL